MVLEDREMAEGCEEDTEVGHDACLGGVARVEPLALLERLHSRQLFGTVVRGIEQKADAGIPRGIVDPPTVGARVVGHVGRLCNGHCEARKTRMVLDGDRDGVGGGRGDLGQGLRWGGMRIKILWDED